MSQALKLRVLQTQKLVHFLQKELVVSSGKKIRRLLEMSQCRVNGTIERFGSAEVSKGSVVELKSTWTSLLETKEKSSFEKLHEDEHLLVVNKPAGWVCIDEECRKEFGLNHYLVHRLDKETTGVLLIAKSVASRDALIQSFKDRKMEKRYYALVDQIPKETQGVCKSFFAKVGYFEGQTCWGSASHGLLAETHWKVLQKGKETSLIACQPITGRTHQIRVHLKELGHPILGDRQYARNYRCQLFVSRPLLHALRIRFLHPLLQNQIDISASLPSDFSEVLDLCNIKH